MAWPPTTHQDVQDEVAALRTRVPSGSFVIIADSGNITPSAGSYTGSVRFVKFSNGLVHITGYTDRATGFNATQHAVGVVPDAAFLPAATETLQAKTGWGSTAQYRYRMTSTGLEIQESAAVGTFMVLSDSYYV